MDVLSEWELLLPDGKYNYVAYLLADENGVFIKVAKYAGMDKVDLVEPIPMREAVINAIVHSDFSREIPPAFEIFSDRMVFTSYGGLIPGQSEHDFFSCSSMPRNRELMRVFKDVGLVEQLGSGMSRILKVYDKSIFNISEHFIKVEIPFSVSKDISSTDNNKESGSENVSNNVSNEDNDAEHKVLEFLCQKPTATGRGMAGELGISDRQIWRRI